MKRICGAILVLFLLSSCASGGQRVTYAPGIKTEEQKETFTLFWYVNGSDLESGTEDDAGGAFTDNLFEMLSALPPDDRVKVVIFTGGTREWKTEGFSSQINQVHTVTREGLTHGPVLGEESIASAQTLAGFLRYGIEQYPADRYALIFWDHGSGVPIGFGYDELREPRYMDLTALRQGLYDGLGGVKLSLLGFDTCLMATVETAAVCAPFADYLLASEELEPFGGWDYAPPMRALGGNPGIDAAELAQVILDGYFSARKNASETLTLSLTDLGKVGGVVDAVSGLASGISETLAQGGFTTVSRMRSRVKYYGGVNQSVDMVDLVHLAQRMSSAYPEEAERLKSAVNECVVMNRHTANAPNSNGLSIYFPYENEGIFKNHLELYMQCGFSEPYISFVRDFAGYLEQGDASLYMVGLKAEQVQGRYRAKVPQEWNILSAQGVLLREKGYGVYLLIGLDDDAEFDENTGNVSGEAPAGWLTVNKIPAFAHCENGDNKLYSVAAELDGRRVSLELSYDGQSFTLLGAVPEAKDGFAPLPVYLPLDKGDTVTLLYPKIDTRRSGQEEEFERGASIVVDEPLEFAFSQAEGLYGFLLTDCYHNQYVTDVRG